MKSRTRKSNGTTPHDIDTDETGTADVPVEETAHAPALASDEHDADTRSDAEADTEAAAEAEADADAHVSPDRPGLEKAAPRSISEAHLKSVLESLVFVSDRPVTAQQLAKISRSTTKDVQRLLAELIDEYQGRGIALIEVAGGYQFRSAALNAPFVRDFVAQRPVRLTRAQLETLAIVGYRQPVTRPEIDDIRGVDSGSPITVLADRGLIKILGRKDEAGRPLLYGTTPYFLEFFGLASLRDLPTLREFSDLTEESRALFERKMGEPIAIDDSEIEHLSSEELSADEAADEDPPTDDLTPEA